jgi:hypothetical protein
VAENMVVEFPDDLLELLPDAELLAVCDTQLPLEQQEELSDMLQRQREGLLRANESAHLEELMHRYRAGLVRKAQAIKVAVNRGLRPRLS